MNMVIIGRGSIGLLLAHFCQNQHISVSNRQVLPLAQVDNFTFSNLLGKSEQHAYMIADAQCLANADVIICCVKSYNVKHAISNLLGSISEHTPIILAHNGMGVNEELQSLAIANPIMGLLTTMGAKRLAPHHVIHTGQGVNQLGLINASGETSLVKQKITAILETFSRSLPNFEYEPRVQKFAYFQWQKLAINCAINGISARDNIKNGELSHNVYKQEIQAIIAELVKVAEQVAIKLEVNALLKRVYMVIELTANNSSSMREDIVNQRKTEIEYINGYISKLGRIHAIATPANSKIYQQVIQLTRDFI